MSVAMLRRRKLGRTSCREIAGFSNNIHHVVRNDKPMPDGVTLVIRWGTTSNVPVNNVVNTAEAIHRVGDKAGFRRLMMEQDGVLQNRDKLLCPHTFFEDEGYGAGLEDGVNYPVVVRPRVHAQGKHVYLCNNQAELDAAIRRCGAGWYASQYIPKVAEYRVTFVQGRVSWVARKTPADPNAVAWNVARGGRFDNVRWDEWPLKAVRISREAFMLSGLDFGAVDVMVDADGNAYVLEINSAPSQTSPYRQECMAKCFDYLIANGKQTIGVTDQRGGWKKFIHPALSPEAIMV